jgi:hypothetical protein
MNAAHCAEPQSLETLIAYWQGELPETEAELLEEHLFDCAACAGRLETLSAIGAGVARLARGGRVLAAVTLDAVGRAAAAGLRVRSYRLEPGQSVACTIAPEDDVNVVRLAADFMGARRVDVEVVHLEGGRQVGSGRLEDVAVDHSHGELVLLYPGEMIRALPESTFHYQVQAGEAQGPRTLGRYTLEHSPWR